MGKYYTYDSSYNDSPVVVGRVIDNKPEEFGEDDGGINFKECLHFSSIGDCINHIKSFYGCNYKKIYKGGFIKFDESLTISEKMEAAIKAFIAAA